MTSTLPLEALDDRVLLHQFGELVRQDQEGTAALLRHIDAIDRRQLWAKLGHPSMFDFLVVRHRMSESTAGKRIGAARTARRFPVLFEMIARGEIHLSGIHCIKAHLTPENHGHVLAQAKHKTVRQLEQLVAHLAPKPDAPTVLRALPNRAPFPPKPAPAAAASSATAGEPAHTVLPPPKRSPDPAPLAPGRYRLQVTITQEARDKLEQLQDLLAHQIPNADPCAIVERAFDALLAQVLKQKAAITEKPRARKSRMLRRVRAIPAAFRREVWERDQGRCTFVGKDGHRCCATRRLEFAHLKPWGKGGEHSVENITLRCHAHNAFEADRDYGVGFMANKRQRNAPEKCLKVREPVARYVVRGVTNDVDPPPSTPPLSSGSTSHPVFAGGAVLRQRGVKCEAVTGHSVRSSMSGDSGGARPISRASSRACLRARWRDGGALPEAVLPGARRAGRRVGLRARVHASAQGAPLATIRIVARP